MKILVLGCGLVGRLIATDLARDFEVTVLDPDFGALAALSGAVPVRTVAGSALDRNLVAELGRDATVICGAVPGRLGFTVMQSVIELGRPFVDISFMPENFLALDELARAHDVTVIPDMGVAPGMSNLLAGWGARLVEEVEEIRLYVGGLPLRPVPPFNYKIVFSADDVLEEYIRPARYVEDGQVVTVEALSAVEELDFPGVGVLEAFFTDGLRSLLGTVKARRMLEKTMRYPGHASQMRLLREIGLLDDQPRSILGHDLGPRKVLAQFLFPKWKMHPELGDRDLTAMRVVVQGNRSGQNIRYSWDLLDRFDEPTFPHSMARTTGYPCAIMARAVAAGMIHRTGVLAPETLADNEPLFHFMMGELQQRGITFHETVTLERQPCR